MPTTSLVMFYDGCVCSPVLPTNTSDLIISFDLEWHDKKDAEYSHACCPKKDATVEALGSPLECKAM